MWLLLVYRIMKVTNNWTGHHEIIRLRAMDWKLTRPCTSEWVTHLLVWVTDRRQPIPTRIIQSDSLNRLSHWGSESVAVPWEVLGHVMLCWEYRSFLIRKRKKEAVISSASCAPHQPNAQPDRNVYVVPLMRSQHVRREKTNAIQNSGRCSSVAVLKLQAWGFIVAHADKCFIDINWMYGDIWEFIRRETSFMVPRVHHF